MEGTYKVLDAPGFRGKEQGPHRRLNQTYLLVLEGLLQRQGVAVVHAGTRAMTAAVWEVPIGMSPPRGPH